MNKHNSEFINRVNAAKSHIKEIEIAEVKKMMDQSEDFDLIDVREESEWKNGHLPGAIHLSKGIIERDIEKVIPNNKRKLVLYCGGGSRSALSSESIQKMGYQNVFSMLGGFRAWKEADLPILKK